MPIFVKARNILKFDTRKEVYDYFSKHIPSYREKAEYMTHLNDDDPFLIENGDSYEIGEDIKNLITKYLKESGFDGFELVKDEGISSLGVSTVHTIVVFNSNQIKSATNNVGTFSTEDDNIYHSSVTEESITLMSNVPSIASISDMLPLEQQPEFDALVASAEFETSCR